MMRMGHAHCEYLDVIPAQVVVVVRTDEAVKCRLDGTIVSTPPPPRIVERGVLGNRLIIEATADKFSSISPSSGSACARSSLPPRRWGRR
jgi:transposase